MILWTIQPKEVADLLETSGRFSCDGRRADRDYRDSYLWMATQMANRGITNPEGRLHYPVWAWYRFNHRGKHKRGPRIVECQETCPLNTPFCRIKFDAPDNLVLLSDFALWHCVLNKHYIGTDRSEKRAIKRALSRPQENFLSYMRRSWERIFNLDLKTFESKVPCWGTGDKITIQACLPYILSDWVLQVDHFITTERSMYYRRKWGMLAEPGFGRGQTR